MVIGKIALAVFLASAVVVASAWFDAWRNRRKYETRERQRKASGGLR